MGWSQWTSEKAELYNSTAQYSVPTVCIKLSVFYQPHILLGRFSGSPTKLFVRCVFLFTMQTKKKMCPNVSLKFVISVWKGVGQN